MRSSHDEARLDSTGERSRPEGAVRAEELESRLRSAEDAVRSESAGRIKELEEALQHATEQAARSADLEKSLSGVSNKLKDAEILAEGQANLVADLGGRLREAEEEAKSVADLKAKLRDAEGQARKAAGLRDKLRKAEEEVNKAVEGAKGARDWARSTEARWKAASSDLEALQAASNKLHKDFSEADEARVRAEARYSSAQVEILRISKESSQKILHLAAELDARASEKAEAMVAGRVAEAKKLAVESFRRSSAYQRDLGEASADAYSMGFEDCRSKVSQRYPGIDFGGVSLMDTPYTPQVEDSPPFSPSKGDGDEPAADPAEGDEAPEV